MTLVVFVILCKICVRFLLLASSGGFLLPSVAAGASFNWQYPASLVDSNPRFLSAKRSAVSSLREEVAQRNPLEGVPLDSSRNRGTASLWHPGAARYRNLSSRALLRTFERSIVGGTTDLLDPTRRKANFLWKFLCAGAAIPDCAGDPIPTAVPPQGFLQSKNALRRRKTVSSLLGSLIVE